MFSHHLRRPSHRSGHLVGDERPSDPCRSIRDALYSDLLRLRSKYENEINKKIIQAEKFSAGSAFGLLQDVLLSAKVALLHTHLAPKRCDRSAYSQLLYAVCWSFLYEAFQEWDAQEDSPEASAEDMLLIRASYAIFALYVLHETNTLPKAEVKSEEEILSLLPVGLNQNVDNPGYLYRRHFRQPIRVDLNHFYCMQRLFQIALTREAQHRATEAVDDSTTNAVYGYIVAIDTIEIGRHLQPYLSICSYTGPCSLEGLTDRWDFCHYLGHERGYLPHPMDSLVSSDRLLSATDVNQKHKIYLEVCRAIRFPSVPSNPGLAAKIKRIDKALEVSSSLRDTIRTERLSETLLTSLSLKNSTDNGRACLGPTRTDSPGSGTAGLQYIDSNDGEMNSCDFREDGFHVSESIPSFKLILPEGMTSPQQKSLRAAVEVLLSRHKAPMVVPFTLQSHAKVTDIHPSGTDDGDSYAEATIESGIGRKTWHHLWGRVVEKHVSGMDWFAEDDVEEPKETSGSHRHKDNDELSDISLNDEEIIGVASTVGHEALSELLFRSSKRKREMDSQADNGAGKTIGDNSFLKRPHRTTRNSSKCQESFNDSCSSDGSNDVAENGGVRALAKLLSMAQPSG